MSKQLIEQILAKIEQYNRIFIFRHIRMDGDCTGATKGLKEILKISYPEKEIYLIDEQKSDFLAFLGEDDPAMEDSAYEGALAIVLDTATSDRISNKKYTLCKEIIKIDHHIPVEDYGNINWVEENRCSTCELIAHFYANSNGKLKINQDAAKYLFTGLVTDSGRFRFREVNGDTMRIAGMLLDVGIDLDTLYAHLYMQSFESLKYKAYIYKTMKQTENGVSYFYVSNATQKRLGLTREEASAGISAIENIKDSLIWIAFIENEDKSIRVRLRSRFVTVSEIGNKYHGGGHACASGATVYSKQELESLVRDADERLKEYKANNGGWL
ncbi:MAG: bifunctional oligoribonuclease/PAP phosphatase NrnA [Clostridia bacterium]|nr:bifunctional oligoribonuclease/PAP phosphatase NrnA [Clostridia bacterium]